MARIEDEQQLDHQPDTATTTTEGNGFSIAAIVSGVLAVLLAPIVFGPLAIILAFVARNRMEPRAQMAMTVAVIGTAAGFILAIVLSVLATS